MPLFYIFVDAQIDAQFDSQALPIKTTQTGYSQDRLLQAF
jgi:hypothetical protein